MLWSILGLIVQVCSLTVEYRVVQYVPSFSISEQFESIRLTILPRISLLLLWSDGRLGMELILCRVVESFCLPTHSIVPHVSWHDLPCYRTTKRYSYFPGMVIFRLLLRKFWIQTWLFNSNMVLWLSTISLLISHCLWVHPRYRSTTRPFVFLVLWLHFVILQMTHVHQWGKMNFCGLRPCFIDHLWFVSDFCYVPRLNLFKFLPFFIHCCFCCGSLHCLRHRKICVPYCNAVVNYYIFLRYGPHDNLVKILPYAFLWIHWHPRYTQVLTWNHWFCHGSPHAWFSCKSCKAWLELLVFPIFFLHV